MKTTSILINYANVQVWTKALNLVPGASKRLHYPSIYRTASVLGYFSHTNTHSLTHTVEFSLSRVQGCWLCFDQKSQQ